MTIVAALWAGVRPAAAQQPVHDTAALAKETRAATLLGNAPGAPTIYELPIPISVFGAWDMALGPDGRSVWLMWATRVSAATVLP